MIGRRSVLKFLGASPIVAREAAEQAAKSLSGVTRGGMGMPGLDIRDIVRADAPSTFPMNDCANIVGQQTGSDWRVVREMRDKIILDALRTKESRRELETILYENHRTVHGLDHDIAANRSWSLAAKLVYQRQRNVERDIEHTMMNQNPWERARDWKDRILSFAGIKM